MYRLLLVVILSAKLSEYNWFTFTRSPQTLYRPVMFTGISISSFSASTYICDMWRHMACTLESSSPGFSHCGPIVCSSMSVEFLWQADSGHLFGGISEPCVYVCVCGWLGGFVLCVVPQATQAVAEEDAFGWTQTHTCTHTYLVNAAGLSHIAEWTYGCTHTQINSDH